MSTITDTIFIERPIKEVFDVVTTTKYWPIWHTQCEKVEGATENPIQLNEESSEHVKLGPAMQVVTWKCTYHERPYKLRLDGITRGIKSYIEYTFTEHEGGIEFTRLLHYKFNRALKIAELLTRSTLKRHQKNSMENMKQMLLDTIQVN